MSFPFGSGMPHHHQHNHPPNMNNTDSHAQSQPSYPPPIHQSYTAPYPQQIPSYPGSSSAPYPQMISPYPQTTAPYPQSTSSYPSSQPSYPTYSAPFGSGYAQNTSPFPTNNMYPSIIPPNSTPYPNSSYGSGGMPQYPMQNYSNIPPPQLPSSTNNYPKQPLHYGGYQPMNTGGTGGMSSSQSLSAYRRTHSKGQPTIVPAPDFNAVADAKALRKAMKGWGTDEDALINVICQRSNEQRLLIEKEYKTNFGKDLIDDLKSETSGNFEKLLIALMTPIVDFYVKELYQAMDGLGTDEDVLIEVLCSMSNYEINVIKSAFERKYGKQLESELMSETSGNFKRLLVSLCTAGRDESGAIDIESACQDATALLRAGELRVGTDESTFNMVLCQRNYGQIRLICDEYEKMTGHTLEKAIENEFSGDILDGLVAIIQCTSNKAEFFARQLHKSMAGLGTNDRQLIRILVTRSEVDLNDIKVAFERLYGESLRSWIKGDTSGHYKHALYALIGEERSS